MILNEIAREIGITKYNDIPEAMHQYYPIPEDRVGELCNMELIDHLQQKFDFFREYYEAVKISWAAMEKDEKRKAYVDAASLFMLDYDYEDVVRIPVPKPDETLAGDLLSLFILLPSVEKAYEDYQKRGFSEAFAMDYMKRYYSSIRYVSEKVVGRPALNGVFYRWLCLYTKTRMFDTHGFDFELHRFQEAYILRNKENGELLPLSLNQLLHRSGLPLGCAGAEDPKGAVQAQFQETEDAYWGHAVENYKFSLTPATYPKTEWEIAMQPGDITIMLHIPGKCDISVENFYAALEDVKRIARQRYVDLQPKMLSTHSWFLCPELEHMMRPDSKVILLADCFTRFPLSGASGKSVFGFVFPPGSHLRPLEELQEDTSLMRAVKTHYMAGGYILDYNGVIAI
jgi:hypothetical protein